MLESPAALATSVICALALMVPLGRFLEVRDLAGFCAMEGNKPTIHGHPFSPDYRVDCQ
jgi:hypothetical protein